MTKTIKTNTSELTGAALKAFALDDPVIRSRKEHEEMISRLTAEKGTK